MTEVLAALKEAFRRLKALEDWAKKLADQLGAVDQRSKQGSGQGFGGGSNSPPIRIWLPTGIAAGTFGTPAVKTDCEIAVRSGNGWTRTGATTGQTIYNSDTTAVGSNKAGWAVVREDGSLELLIADC